MQKSIGELPGVMKAVYIMIVVVLVNKAGP